MTVGRLLGIDHGLKRIGVAVSDDTGLVARALTIIHRKSKKEDFIKLNDIAQSQRITAIVVGIPSDDDAPPGTYTQAERVRKWVAAYGETTDLPIVLWDEHLSSVDALELARRQGRKPEAPIDDLAARLILQSYLDALHDGLATPPPRPAP